MNFKVKSGDEIDMMKRLINYGKVDESQTNTGMLTPRLEYSAVAADGKTYGIIKECNKFYIKVAPPKDTKLVAEDFDYIGGYMNKKENEYSTYPIASKQFNLKMMSINESHTKKKEITQFKKEEESDWQVNETKEMRSELNRFKQIMENVGIILNEDSNAVATTNKVPEAPATNPSEKERNKPFTDTAVAKGDEDFTKTQTDPTKAGAPFVEDDKNSSTKNTNTVYSEKPKFAPVNTVAVEKPSGGGKAVRVESKGRTIKLTEAQVLAWSKDKNYMDTSNGTEIGSSAPFTDKVGEESNQTEAHTETIHEETVAHLAQNQNTPKSETGNVGDTAPYDEKVNESYFDDDDDDPTAAWDRELSAILKGDKNRKKARSAAKSQIDKEKTDAEKDDAKVTAREKDVRGEIEIDDCKQHMTNEEYVNPTDVEGMEGIPFPEVEDTYGEEEYYANTNSDWGIGSGGNNVWEPDVEEDYYGDIDPEDREGMFGNDEFEHKLDNVVDSIIREAKLDVFGKHPAYRKTPMTLPPNKEVAPNGARDWNDKSVEGEEPFGSKIGSGAPFDEKVMNVLVDAVMQRMGFQEKA